jgi:hypothetical protein
MVYICSAQLFTDKLLGPPVRYFRDSHQAAASDVNQEPEHFPKRLAEPDMFNDHNTHIG